MNIIGLGRKDIFSRIPSITQKSPPSESPNPFPSMAAADMLRPVLDRGVSTLTIASTFEKESTGDNETPATSPGLGEAQQWSFDREAMKISSRLVEGIEELQLGHIQRFDLEQFLEYLSEERLMHMPVRNSAWDKMLRQAAEIGAQVGYLADFCGQIFGGKLTLIAIKALLDVGHHQAELLRPVIELVSQLFTIVLRKLHQSSRWITHPGLKRQLENLLISCIRFAGDLAVHVRQRITRLSLHKTASIDVAGAFGPLIDNIEGDIHGLDQIIWALALQGQHNSADVETIAKRLHSRSLKNLLFASLNRLSEVVSGTCEWFQFPLTDLLRGTSPVLQVEGASGSGKTTLATWTQDRLHRQIGRRTFDTLVFGPQDDLQEGHRLLNIVRPLLQQIWDRSTGDDQLFTEVTAAFAREDHEDHLAHQLLEIVQQTIKRTGNASTTLVIVDGLHSADEAIFHDLARAIEKSGSHLLVFGEKAFENFPAYTLTSDLNRSDLHAYLDRGLHRLAIEHDANGVEKLVAAAGGSFIWAYLYLKWRSLDNRVDASFDCKLDLEALFKGVIKALDESAISAIRYMLVAARPLCWEELSAFFNAGVVRSLQTCRIFNSLVIKTNGRLVFRHSVFERMLKRQYLKDEKAVHAEVLRNLLLHLKYAFPDAAEPSFDLLQGTQVQTIVQSDRLIEYAVEHWLTHYRLAQITADKLADCFPASTRFALLEWSYYNHMRHLERHRLALEIRKKCLSEDHRAVIQTYLSIACIYRAHNDLEHAAEYFYFACKVGREGKSIDRFAVVITTCASLFLTCTQQIRFETRTVICTMREEIIRYTIEVWKRQEGEHCDQVVYWYKVLIDLMVSIKETHLVIILRKELYAILVIKHGPKHPETRRVCDDLVSLDVVVQGEDEGKVDLYLDILLETGEDPDEGHGHGANLWVLIRLARQYAKHKHHWHHAQRLYLAIWLRLGEICRRQWTLEMALLQIDICIEYAKLLHHHGHVQHAHEIMVVLWAEFHGRESCEYDIIIRLKQLGCLMRAFGLLDICIEVFGKLLGWFKGCGRGSIDDEEGQGLTIIITEVLEEVEEVHRKVTTTTITTKTETVTREIFEIHLERCHKTGKGDKHLYKACLLLVNLLLAAGSHHECEVVITKTLKLTWKAFFEFNVDVCFDVQEVESVLYLCLHLAHCHRHQDRYEEAEMYYLRLWHICLRTFDIQHEHVTVVLWKLIAFYEDHYRCDKMIEIYLDVLIRYRQGCGNDHHLTIKILYALGTLCRKMGRKDYIDYYLAIMIAFKDHKGHLPPIAWEAAWVICLYHAGRSDWGQVIDVCGIIWTVLKAGKGKREHDHFFSAEIVIRLYELYIRGLRAHGKYSFKFVYELSIEYREIVKIRYGCDTTIWIKVLIALAGVCEEHEEHHHEAVTYYKEVITRKTTTTVTTITEEEITVVRKRLSKIYVTIIAGKGKGHKHSPQLGDEALQICWELYLEFKAKFGCWHETTLRQFERVILIHFHLGGQHRAKIMGLVKVLILEIVSTCTDSIAAHRAGLIISVMLLSVHVHVEIHKMLLKLHHVIALPGLPCEHDFDLEWKHDRQISLVFVFTCLRGLGHCHDKSYSEVMAAVLLEIQLYNDFRRVCEAKHVDIEIFLQVSVRLHQFWLLAGRSTLCGIIATRTCAIFRTSTLGQCLGDLPDEKVLILVGSLLVHLKDEGRIEDMAKAVCVAVNHSVKELLLAGNFTRAHDLARVMLVLAKHHAYWSEHVSLGYKLAEYMAGIDVPRTTDKKLLKAMAQTSREITDMVLEALHRADLQLHLMQLCDVTGLLMLLGWQENFRALERLLLSLWQSREVQRTWRSSTVLSIGHALVHAHIAAGHLDQAVVLCDTICYNLRRSGDWLDEQAIVASNLLAQIYTLKGEHEKAIAVYEEDLRAIVEEESNQVFDRWATKELDVLRSAVARNKGFPRNINSYKDIFARLGDRGLSCNHAEWVSTAEENLEGVGIYERPQYWYRIGDKEGREGQLKRHNSLSQIAARRSRGVLKLPQIADARSVLVI